MVSIIIHSFVFNLYKIKSYFLVPIKFSIGIFSLYKNFPSTFFVPKMLEENVIGTKKCDFIL